MSASNQHGMLKLLHAEDDPDDALLCQLQLERAGLSIDYETVATRDSFVHALAQGSCDIVLTDYKLPGWSGLEVLRLLAQDGRDIPCILVTGSVGEEMAAQCIKLGASDYILKDRPARLPFAIESALEERRERTRRREAESKCNRLASIVESSVDAIIGADPDGAIKNWNPGAERMFALTANEVFGRRIESLFNEPVPVTSGTNTIERFETRGIKKTGEWMDLAVTISPIQDAEGYPAGTSAIIRDITEAKRQQQDLLTAQKLEAIGQLAGGVAHDFNNLLTVINGYARMLQKKGSGDPAKVDAILQAGERGQRLTKQLLLFSRKQITQFKPIQLNSLILGFLDMLRPLIGADIELRTVLDGDLRAVLADAGQMEQVVMNLVVNARDAMPEGGVITIETRNARLGAADEVTLSVADSGTGMPPEVQARIFEPFFTTKEPGRGTGLGLSTSCGIIAHSKGTMRVQSELGRGTTFTIHLPACDIAEKLKETSTANIANHQPPATGTILLAEDDATVRTFVVSVLEERGYKVLAAENGPQALDLCAQYDGEIKTLVSDVVMPEMNGRVLADKVRQLRPNLNVLFMSGYVDRGLRDEDLLSRGCAFIEKPFTGEALTKIVDDLCRVDTALALCS